MIALGWDNTVGVADLVRDGGNLVTDDGLETAVLISLFTDRRAASDDELPGGTDDKRGWPGDAYAAEDGDQIGSRLWLLERATATPETLRLAEEYAREALAWMVADGVASEVTATASYVRTDAIGLSVSIAGPTIPGGRWTKLWEVRFGVR